MKNEFRLSVVSAAGVLALLLSASAFLVTGAQEPSPTATLEEPTATASATAESTATEEPTATLDATTTETASETLESTATETEIPSETPTLESTPTPSETATGTLTETPTLTSTPTPTATKEMGDDAPLTIAVFDLDEALWCPATVSSPVELSMGCTAAYTDLSALFAFLAGSEPSVDGTVWIGTNYLSTNDATINGATETTMAAFMLTFKGGWTGPGGTVDTADPSDLTHRLVVQNWGNAVTMNDLDVNASGSAGTGLLVSTTGNITLTRVDSFTANGRNAELINSSGTGTITVNSSNFNTAGSLEGGLFAGSNGNITLNNVQATFNSGFGAWIELLSNPAQKLVISNSVFSSNGGSGLTVNSLGNITLTNVDANSNFAWGAYLNNSAVAGTGTVAITGSDFGTNGGLAGLQVYSNNTITLTNVTANSNTGGRGASLDNTTASTAKNVTLAGVNEFNNNHLYGLRVDTKGAIALNDVTANFNGLTSFSGDGTYLANTSGTAGLSVTLTGTNVFSGNYFNGLTINSEGTVKLNNIIANSNLNGPGLDIDNTSAASALGVTLTGTSQFSYNGGAQGLLIESKGAIALNNITANATAAGTGIYLDNNWPGLNSAVTLTGANMASENEEHGIRIDSVGPVALSNVTANDNGFTMVSGYGVTINNSGAATFQKVSLSGVNSISDNYWDNLNVVTNGAIAINSLTANGSATGHGMDLDNTSGGFTNSKQPITLTGTNAANDNFSNGVNANSYGAITINNLTANMNTNSGAYLNNDFVDTPMAVTLNGMNTFSDNTSNGLEIESDGAIKANSVTAHDNGANGAYILNTTSASGSVTFTGTNSFDGNGGSGVYAETTGAIALSNVSADSNLGGHGLDLVNTASGAGTPKNVTLSGVNTANNNSTYGVLVSTFGDVSVSSLTATNNGVDGASFDNSGGTTAKKVTLTGTNSFVNNGARGLDIVSRGAISVSNLTANDNTADGATLNNTPSSTSAGVTLTGTNTFNTNDDSGLTATSLGPITASNLRASGNTDAVYPAVTLQNHSAAGPQKITVSGVNTITGNVGQGMSIFSKGAVSVNSLTSTGNLGGLGLELNNANGLPSSPQAVTLTGTNLLSTNAGRGLDVLSFGPISIANLTASSNSNIGALLDNDGSALPQKVTFTGANTFNLNAGDGLQVSSLGSITSATSLTANGNTVGSGMYLFNADGDGSAEVNLKGSVTANNNNLHGIDLNSYGAVTLNNVTANENGITGSLTGYGANLNNTGGGTPKDIKLTGTNVLNGNYFENLRVLATGAISLNNVTANSSVTLNGASLDNTTTEGKPVTITGTNYFNDNNVRGLRVVSFGTITTNNISANRNLNAGHGVELDNSTAASPRAVTMNGTNVFIDNDGNGLELISKGVVTLNNLHAHYNVIGANVNNGAGVATVALNGVNYFRHNTVHGAVINSAGAVTVNKTTAEDNTGDGLFVDNLNANITLMCGTFTDNTQNGVDLHTDAPGVMKLIGIVAAGNGSPQIDITGTGATVTVRACP